MSVHLSHVFVHPPKKVVWSLKKEGGPSKKTLSSGGRLRSVEGHMWVGGRMIHKNPRCFAVPPPATTAAVKPSLRLPPLRGGAGAKNARRLFFEGRQWRGKLRRMTPYPCRGLRLRHLRYNSKVLPSFSRPFCLRTSVSLSTLARARRLASARRTCVSPSLSFLVRICSASSS